MGESPSRSSVQEKLAPTTVQDSKSLASTIFLILMFVLTISTFLNALSCSYVIGWFNICFKDQLNRCI